MLTRQSHLPHTALPYASGENRRAVFAQRTPRNNQLLAALPLEDYERLLPELELVHLPQGYAMHRPGEREKSVYFLTDGIVSRFYVTENGASAGFALTGREGVVGIAAFLGDMGMPSHAVTLCEGYAYRLRGDLVRDEFEQVRPLAHLLLRYTQALIAQAGQVAVCNRYHTLEQQLCCWLMSSLDRMPSNELTITQERIADILGVRREGVTEAAGKLQKAGMIHYSRGHISVLDPRRLEAGACECYRVVKHEYDRLLPERMHAEVAC